MPQKSAPAPSPAPQTDSTAQADAAVERRFQRDPDGLKAAYDAYGATIYSFCVRSLGQDAAQDATQEVFIAAWRTRERFDPALGSLVGWLMGIARYRVLGSLRTTKRQPLSVAEPIEDPQPSVDQVEQMADRMLVANALRSLPERARTAVTLAYIEGLSHQEVADRMDCPLGTVKSDIRRGLAQMRRGVGVDHV